MDGIELGRYLRDTRGACGWQQKFLAIEARVSQVTLSHLESGKIRRPRAETEMRLRRAIERLRALQPKEG